MNLGRYTGDVFKVVACPGDSGAPHKNQGTGATEKESQGTFAQKNKN